MGNSAVPTREGEYTVYAKQFMSAIKADPAMYRVTEEEMVDLETGVAEWTRVTRPFRLLETTPKRLNRPGRSAGALACRIHIHVGPTAPADPAEYTFVAQTDRSLYHVMHDNDDRGKIAHFILQWVNTREETGLWSTPISGIVPAI